MAFVVVAVVAVIPVPSEANCLLEHGNGRRGKETRGGDI